MLKKLLTIGSLCFLIGCQSGSDFGWDAQDPEEVYFEENRNEIIQRASFQEELEDVLSFGIPDDPENVNPFTFKKESESIIIHTLYRDLFRMKDPMNKEEVELDLLEEFTNSEDREFTLILKKMNWSDGVPMTVDDIIYTIEETWENPTNYLDDFKVHGKKLVFDKIDDQTLKIILDEDSNSFIYYLRDLIVVPQHIFEEIGTKEMTDLSKLVGNSSYTFKEVYLDEEFGMNRYAFVENEETEEKAKFPIIEYRATNFSENNTSRFDLEDFNLQVGYVETKDIPAMSQTYFDIFTFEDKTLALVFKTNTEIGANEELRKAIGETIIPNSLIGYYGNIYHAFPTNTIFSEKTSLKLQEPFYQQNKKSGMDVLRDYQLGNPDFKVRFGFLVQQGNPQEGVAILLQENYRAAGINIEVVPLFDEEYEELTKDPNQDEFDFFLYEIPATDNAYSYRHLFDDSPWNVTDTKDEEILELFEKADKEEDYHRKMDYYQDIQRKMLEDGIIKPLLRTERALIVDNRLTNIEQAGVSPYRFFNRPGEIGYEDFGIDEDLLKEYDVKKSDLLKDKRYKTVNTNEDILQENK